MRLEDQVTEIYSQRGHHVQQEIKRNAFTTDLIAKSAKGEKWIVRCITNSQVDTADVDNALHTMQREKARQIAIITTASVTANARVVAKGKSVFLIDGLKFQEYWQQAQAHEQIENAPLNPNIPPKPSSAAPQIESVATGEVVDVSSLGHYPDNTNAQQEQTSMDGNKPTHGHLPRNDGARILVGGLILVMVCAIGWLVYDMSKLKAHVEDIEMELNHVKTVIVDMDTELSNVGAIARNADKYAHTHNAYSDARLKTNIQNIEQPLQRLLSLRGVRFEWNNQAQSQLHLDTQPQIGFIAQEVEKVYPEFVSTDDNGYKTLDYSKFVPVLVEAIKEQQQMIAALDNQISTCQQK